MARTLLTAIHHRLSSTQNIRTLFMEIDAFFSPLQQDENYEAYYDNADTYKRQLEERYPLACEQCLDKVHRKLTQQNYQIKSNLLNATLSKSRGDRITPTRKYPTTGWLVAGSCWLLAHATLSSVEVIGMHQMQSRPLSLLSLIQRITFTLLSDMFSPCIRRCRSFFPSELETIQTIKAFSRDSRDFDTEKHPGCNAQSSPHGLTAEFILFWSTVRAVIRGRVLNNHRCSTGCIVDHRTLLEPLGVCGPKNTTDTDSYAPILPMGPKRGSSSHHRPIYWIIHRIIAAAPELGVLGTADPPYPVSGRISQWPIHSRALGCQARWLRHAYTNSKTVEERW